MVVDEVRLLPAVWEAKSTIGLAGVKPPAAIVPALLPSNVHLSV